MLLLSGSAAAQGSGGIAEDLAALRSRIEELLGLEPSEERSPQLQEALTSLDAAGRHRAQARDLRADVEGVPALTASLEQELPTLEGPPEFPDANGRPLAELRAELERVRAKLATARTQLQELETLATTRSARRSELPERIAQATAREEALEETLEGLPEDAELLRLTTRAQLIEVREEMERDRAEQASIDARRELLPLRIERAKRLLARAEATEAHWTSVVDASLTREADASAEEAAARLAETARRYPRLKDLASRTRELAERRTGEQGTPTRIRAAQDALDRDRNRLAEAQRRSRSAHRRVDAGGLTEAMGLILRRDFEWLARPGELRAARRQLESEMAQAQLELITLEEERTESLSVSAQTQELLRELGVDEGDTQTRAYARELVVAHEGARAALISDLTTLTGLYYSHREKQVLLEQETLDYRGFIERQILWVRSTPSNPVTTFRNAGRHATAIIGAVRWAEDPVSPRIRGRVRAGAFALFAIVILIGTRFLKRKREEMGTLVRSYKTDRYLYTVRAVLQSAVLAAPLPLFLYASGLAASDSSNELFKAWGEASAPAAVAWFLLRYLIELTVAKSVGQAHFRWPVARMTVYRRAVRRAQWLYIPACLLFLTLDAQSNTAWSDSIGRAGFVVAMGVLSLLLWRCLRIEENAGTTFVQRTRKAWSLLASVVPAALALFALCGFYYTALQLESRVRHSILFLLAVVLVSGLMHRWLYMARRKLAVAQALEARARKEEEEEESLADPAPGVEPDQVDIPSIDEKTRRLFQSSITLSAVVGMFLLWSTVLPALQGLDRVQLYPEWKILEAEVDPGVAPVELEQAEAGTSPMPLSPGPKLSSPEKSTATASANAGVNFTLADLLLAIVFLLLTMVAARNLPALLELALLQRLPLDGGARFAISTIVRYLILLAGVSAVSGALGIGWQQVQWLAAALTFGLAFGLQEIFANFVSGLIILIERPIRVGDTVTVGGVEGRVTQLQMRATTIQDYDLRELLVPNKEFITGQVINWTLTDPVTRVVVPVGVAYGSDTDLARKTLLDAARKISHVLKEPGPSVMFQGFGDSSLDMRLRVFIPNRDVWADCVNRLYTQIDKDFRKAGIEIAFPQRDVHIRTHVKQEGDEAKDS